MWNGLCDKLKPDSKVRIQILVLTRVRLSLNRQNWAIWLSLRRDIVIIRDLGVWSRILKKWSHRGPISLSIALPYVCKRITQKSGEKNKKQNQTKKRFAAKTMSSTAARLFLSKTFGKVILPDYSVAKSSLNAQRRLHTLCRSLVTVSLDNKNDEDIRHLNGCRHHYNTSNSNN